MSPRIFFHTIRMRSKNIFFHGAVLAFYAICVVTTFVYGIYGFSKIGSDTHSVSAGNNDNGNYDYNLRLLRDPDYGAPISKPAKVDNYTNGNMSIS